MQLQPEATLNKAVLNELLTSALLEVRRSTPYI